MKKKTHPIYKHEILSGDLTFTFLNTGDIFEIRSQRSMINQLNGNVIDGSLNNIFLRIHNKSTIKWCPLVGVKSPGTVHFAADSVQWKGTFENVAYRVTFSPDPSGIWFWKVELEGERTEVDIVYGQDLGLGEPGMVRNNEAYASQYIDHKPFLSEEKGFVVTSRQNLPQSGSNPYIQQGCLGGAKGYSTDGFQFFGLSYKETNEPELLNRPSFPNMNYQYEFAYTALQSDFFQLNGSKEIIFYGLFKENHPDPVKELEFEDEVAKAWNRLKNQTLSTITKEKGPFKSFTGGLIKTVPLTDEELHSLFPQRIFEEKTDGELASFFTDTYEHVVLPEKELRMERPHGHILMTGNNDRLEQQVMTTTSYMYGIFNSQVALDNTSFNKMTTNARNPLNIPKTSGQRIYIEKEGTYQLLAVPSVFEMGFNYARWYYKTEDALIIVTNYTVPDDPVIQLEVESENGQTYRFLVTNQVSMENHEYDQPFFVEEKEGSYIFSADENAVSNSVFPELAFKLTFDGTDTQLKDETALTENPDHETASLIVHETDKTASWKMMISGSLSGEFPPDTVKDFSHEKETYRQFFKELMNGFKLEINGSPSQELESLNTLAWWYTHNMLVHYSVPHGLEQYGAAAWGTRDVCQGPAEYFLAMQKYDQVKDILRVVYSHQYKDTGNWPQWFMFDEYSRIQQEESHGDIIVWPLKLLADYLEKTGDTAFLKEELPYTDRGSKGFTDGQETLLHHMYKQIDYIKGHFLHDTFLSSYGDGDWDDTLQPANQELKQYMVSSWTVALTFQVLTKLAGNIKESAPEKADELAGLARGIEKDYQAYIRDHQVIPGFLYLEDKDKPEKMLHPTDNKTGINYRLLPMIRSMISELFNEEEVKDHYELIKEHLFFPDGVRLMNQPAQYEGGVSKHFKRAEQAANFGREIGLQYVHAHIRFIEAMAKIGKADDAWAGLKAINPIGIHESVPNADLRQSNAYFSSSDGKFNTRYDAAENFHLLKKGKVKVKGGWRIYSSGPGIYINQLISHVLGIREEGDKLILDPSLPEYLDGLNFNFSVDGHPATVIYHFSGEPGPRVKVNGTDVPSEHTFNRYRPAGLKINKRWIDSTEMNEIDLYM
ncbi:GH36-type glycosyl hydrolase domain-containing protein [Salipaludibacillus aurantiacus]|uniref:Cellobiose phosphorylase n=1 Tax=Salipaludibacillus aurantiacus TaxID=1601833 RepID=A0A1H9W650_9BACI|nr:cellobiose phosphorylase [Salipaludibacillus aurantiacus]SES29335.1 Cellobiose phosphorylase [Salipaludibacillus aurantiacus]